MSVGAAAVVLPLAAGLAGATVSTAAPLGPVHSLPSGYQDLLVPSSMGPIKVQVQWARRGGNAALYLLDGMRARNDYNAWTHDTNAMQQFANDNITLVMPVGGNSSFYSDWYRPASFIGSDTGQQVTYKWETFLTKELPAYLAKFGVSPNNNAILGLSMGGTSALTLAAYHRDQFKFAGSLSGFLNTAAPGMREAMRVAMLDTGPFYNVDAMWGAPWDPRWTRNSPFYSADRMRGLSLFLSSGYGIPVLSDVASGGLGNTVNAVALETLSAIETKEFEIKLRTLGIPATWDYTNAGVHSWPYWQNELWKARPQILDVMNAH